MISNYSNKDGYISDILHYLTNHVEDLTGKGSSNKWREIIFLQVIQRGWQLKFTRCNPLDSLLLILSSYSRNITLSHNFTCIFSELHGYITIVILKIFKMCEKKSGNKTFRTLSIKKTVSVLRSAFVVLVMYHFSNIIKWLRLNLAKLFNYLIKYTNIAVVKLII